MQKLQCYIQSWVSRLMAGALLLTYLLAPLQHEMLPLLHDFEHQFHHITAAEHHHDFLADADFSEENSHDHRSLEYIKQVLEPFGDQLDNEKNAPEKKLPKPQIDKHLPAFSAVQPTSIWRMPKKELPEFIWSTYTAPLKVAHLPPQV